MKTQRMFKNSVLEYLSVSRPSTIIFFHLSIAFLMINQGAKISNSHQGTEILFLAAGFLSWTFFEYILHRFLFHVESDKRFVKSFHYAVHGHHHDHPNDHKHLFMPIVPATIFLGLFFAIFSLLFGNAAYFFMPGFELGYLVYALMHYCIHMDIPIHYIQKMKHHHILHHYRNEEKAFGVSSKLWDKVFGTMP